ncbi:MAG: HAD-IA family hydrolase [Nocardioidaceae bacterium]|nr:HAD-IA family hydrolase [Nocardioidaceae bacterium]NUS52023.1 HAD-IA family hydrolase [Nocardioidaceae bacterium]
MLIRTVLWDADGVLQRVPRGAEESMRPAVEGLVDDMEGFLREALREERPALAGQVRWLDVLPGLLERWGIADSYDTVVNAWLTLEEVPGAHAIVRGLRAAGTRCCLATNQDERRAAYMRDTFGYDGWLDDTFFSCELGAAKPDPAYFEAVLARLDDPPERVLFVDDNAANVAAARGVGLVAEEWSYREGLDALRALLARHGLAVAA